MKHKKGFTLIELLAVIIILAIIALIATPIIMRVIERSKKGAAERSAENYIHAVETEAMALRTEGTILDGTYEIKSNGNLCLDKSTTCNESGEIKIDMNGKKASSGSVVISNGKVTSTGTTLTIEDYIVTINENGSATATKGSGSAEQAYVQVFKPQYYGDWSFMATVGSTDVPASPSTEPPSGKSYYLGYDVSDGKISAAYVCFIRDIDEISTEYCLKGYDTDAYGTNQDIITDAYQDVIDTDDCSFSNDRSECRVYPFSATLTSSGYVDLGRYTHSCYVSSSNGAMRCYDPIF